MASWWQWGWWMCCLGKSAINIGSCRHVDKHRRLHSYVGTQTQAFGHAHTAPVWVHTLVQAPHAHANMYLSKAGLY
jgi:hypothetical protein